MATHNLDHTPEPWKYIDILGACEIYAGQRQVLRYAHSPDAENKANARRIVACVNACAGIDIKYLESPDNLATHARKMMLQRDELLAALKVAYVFLPVASDQANRTLDAIKKAEQS